MPCEELQDGVADAIGPVKQELLHLAATRCIENKLRATASALMSHDC